MYTFDEIIAATEGNPVNFYGVDGNRFKLGRVVFEAIEDPEDGYRSCLDKVAICTDDKEIIFNEVPLTQVVLKHYSASAFDGYILVDAIGHVWLKIGTDSSDGYYPFFVFEYKPSSFTGDIVDALFEK